jgi:hypothetical protein
MPGGQSAVYEFTLPKRELAVGDVHALLRSHCKAYTFQLERGDTTGYEHYQGRLSLFKKTTLACAAQHFPDTGIHISPTVTENTKGQAFYCIKAQTRIDGPWTEKDHEVLPKLCWPYNEEDWDNPLPWQLEMFERIRHRVKRTIYCIIDPRGGNGKTSFVKKAKSMGLCREVPPMSTMEDIMAWIMCFPPQKTYIIDMPRAMKKRHLASFFAGVESLKNGYAYDKRYKGKEMDFDSPNILVFTNKKPKLSYLSRDRWRLFSISKDKRLIDFCFRDAEAQDVNNRRATGSQEGRESTNEEEASLEEEVHEREGWICESSEECDFQDSGDEV